MRRIATSDLFGQRRPAAPVQSATQRHVHSVRADGANRAAGDFYVTPPVAVRHLLTAEHIPSPCWECACGNGSISEVLIEAGIKVRSTDYYDRGYGEGQLNFLTRKPRFKFNSIVTNPPYEEAQEFVNRALLYRCDKVIMLMRLLWL